MALPDAAGEERMMKKLFKATAVKARALDVQKLLRTPGSFDLLHFGGHAEAAGEQQADARLLLDQLDDGSTENALLRHHGGADRATGGGRRVGPSWC